MAHKGYSVRDFLQGMRVYHIVCGPGVVTELKGGDVFITYDDPRAGIAGRGIYDRKWFKKYPLSLCPLNRRAAA